MSGFDRFEDIAKQRIDSTAAMAEWAPVPVGGRYFSAMDTADAAKLPSYREKTFDEEMKDFHAGVDALRARYAPFLEDHEPADPTIRRAVHLEKMEFRYAPVDPFDAESGWEPVAIPDYRGPIGRWKGQYRTQFAFDRPREGRRAYLCFQGVDYRCSVLLNGIPAGSHEGFFASFAFDVTDMLRAEGPNTLLVEIFNDIPTIGNDSNTRENGDKLYAATGLGWDDSQTGWHHCPPGAGIFDGVRIEERQAVHFKRLSVVPYPEEKRVRCTAEIQNDSEKLTDIGLRFDIFASNFVREGPVAAFAIESPEICGFGVNYYYADIPMAEFRTWTQDEPWMYLVRARLSGPCDDTADAPLGMRSFRMDESREPKGTLSLNGREIFLRGANDMGHMQQCVLKRDWKQLIDDILIAKYAGMNFYRFTQRPVQREIYAYCDRLGMLNQTDFPLFGYLRRNQFVEALRQVGEMEDHIASHPSAILVTYMNEAINTANDRMNNRHLNRDELENFFRCADTVIAMKDPTRVIKHVEGDYQPPTLWGLSDFHCYNLWYTNHALPIGRLYKGWLPKTQKGWKTGCGEYGTEGLDSVAVMTGRYPVPWLPGEPDGYWNPGGIVQSQTNSMHGDWFEEQGTLEDWVRESQKHQAFAAKIHTECLRRRSDMVVSTAIHLLIDAWPSGWMKSIVGVDRVPKPAYFAFRRSLKPLRLSIRCDRWAAYSGESVAFEIWSLNDTDETKTGWSVKTVFRADDRILQATAGRVAIRASASECVGAVRAALPEPAGENSRECRLDAFLIDETGEIRDVESFAIRSHARPVVRHSAGAIGKEAERAAAVLGAHCASGTPLSLLISSAEAYREREAEILTDVRAGATAVFLTNEDGDPGWTIDGVKIEWKRITGLTFTARNADNSYAAPFGPGDFLYFYHSEEEQIDFIARHRVEFPAEAGISIDPILFTYKKPGFHDSVAGHKERLPIVAEYNVGAGRIVLFAARTQGMIGCNPVLDRLLLRILGAVD